LIGGDERTAVEAGRGHDDLVGGVAVKLAGQVVGFLNRSLQVELIQILPLERVLVEAFARSAGEPDCRPG